MDHSRGHFGKMETSYSIPAASFRCSSNSRNNNNNNNNSNTPGVIVNGGAGFSEALQTGVKRKAPTHGKEGPARKNLVTEGSRNRVFTRYHGDDPSPYVHRKPGVMDNPSRGRTETQNVVAASSNRNGNEGRLCSGGFCNSCAAHNSYFGYGPISVVQKPTSSDQLASNPNLIRSITDRTAVPNPVFQALDSSLINHVASSTIHGACWSGNAEVLKKLCHVQSPDSIDVKQLLKKGKVPFGVPGEGETDSLMLFIEGTPAELAVRSKHFHCANIILGIILHRHYKSAFWTGRKQHSKVIFQCPGEETLTLLLDSLEPLIPAKAHCFFQLRLRYNVDVMLTLLTACLLGLSDVAMAVFDTVDSSYWEEVNKALASTVESGQSVKDINPTCNELLMKAAGIGGDAACLKLVLGQFHRSMTSEDLQQALRGLMALKSPWNMKQFPLCTQYLINLPGPDVLDKMAVDVYEVTAFCFKAYTWLRNAPDQREEYNRLGHPVPSCEEVSACTRHAVALTMKFGSLNTVDVSTLLCRVLSYGKIMSSQSPIFKHLELLLVCVFNHHNIRNILSGSDTMKSLLKDMNEEQRKCVLAMLCQFMVATDPDGSWREQASACSLCHPLVNLLSRANRKSLPLLSPEVLCTVGRYFGPEGLKLSIKRLKERRYRNKLCELHTEQLRKGRFPLYGNLMRMKAKCVVDVLDEVSKDLRLQHLCVVTVLKNQHSDHCNLQKLCLPDGIREYFLLRGFLEKLCRE